MKGLLYLLPEDEIDRRTEYFIERYDRITTAVDRVALLGIPPEGIALVGLDRQGPAWLPDDSTPVEPVFEYLCWFRKGPSITPFQRRITFERFHSLPPVSLQELQEELPTRLAAHLNPGTIPEATWRATLEAIRRLRPSVEAHLDELLGRRDYPRWLGGETRRILGFERDALDLSIRLAGLEIVRTRRPWRAPVRPQAFITGLPAAVVREDTILANDMNVFGDWERLQQFQTGAVKFAQDGIELTVVNINRTPLERTLGADLIYFTDAFNAFVLVQYKMLSKEGEKYVYRPSSDRSVDDKISRMQSIPESEWDGYPLQYRLGPGATYLKFCYREVDPLATTLARGLYLPLELWLSLVASDQLRGPRGGIVLRGNSLPRHLTNSEFVQLVGEGWVGSHGTTSEELYRLIERSLASGRSVTLARSSG